MVCVECGKKCIRRCSCVVAIVALLCLSTVLNMRTPVPWNNGRARTRPLESPATESSHQSSHRTPSSATPPDPSLAPETSEKQKDLSKAASSRDTSLQLVEASSEAGLKSFTGPTPPPLTSKFTALRPSDIKELRTFVLFVGFGKSGHSIVGSLLDAHSEIIIAHEYSVLDDVNEAFTNNSNWLLRLFNNLYANSHRSALSGWRSENVAKKGYTLGMVGNSWQGRVHRLRVIGDKSGALTAKQHSKDKTRCTQLVHKLNSTLGVSVKGIRIIRNPYDTVATRVLIAGGGLKALVAAKKATKSVKHSYPTTTFDRQIQIVFEQADNVERLISQCLISVQVIHLADLIHQPRRVMRELCDSLQVECYSDYLDLCEEKVFKSLSKTRYLVEWSQEQRESVGNLIRRYPEFSRYSFDSDS